MNTQPIEHPEPKLLLIDGLNIVRRVYEAILVDDSPQKAQGAMRSSLASFRRALDEHRPTHALAPFDYGGSTWRHRLYPAYRQKRKPMAQELRDVLPEFREMLEGIGLPTIAVPDVEADDVIATVYRCWARTKKAPAVVVSTDKDLAALIAEGALVRDHFKPEWRDEAWVQRKFGVPASMLQDLLALTGDSSDDIPGVTDVGPKTAARWLLEHGTLEGLLAAAGAIKGKAGEKLRADAELARISRQLVGFKTDIELGLTWRRLRLQEPVAA